MENYPPALAVTPGDASTYDVDESCKKYGGAIIVLFRERGGIAAPMEFINFGDVRKYTKVVPRELVIEHGVDDVPDCPEVIVCGLPVSSEQTAQVVSSFMSTYTEFADIANELTALDLINAINDAAIETICSKLQNIMHRLNREYYTSHIVPIRYVQSRSVHWDSQYIIIQPLESTSSHAARIIRLLADTSNGVYAKLQQKSAAEIGALLYIVEFMTSSFDIMCKIYKSERDTYKSTCDETALRRQRMYDVVEVGSRWNSPPPPTGPVMNEMYTEGTGASTTGELTRYAHDDDMSKRPDRIENDDSHEELNVITRQIRVRVRVIKSIMECPQLISILGSPSFQQIATHLCVRTLAKCAPRTHILDSWIKTMLIEETSHVCGAPGPPAITGDEPFIIPLEHVIALGVRHCPKSVEHATERLEQFVGQYLDKLDLSRSTITGSAIAYSLIITNTELRTCREGYYLRQKYPVKITTPDNVSQFYNLIKNADDSDIRVEYTDTAVAVIIKNHRSGCDTVSHLSMRSGSDVDISVDVDRVAEFIAVVDGHFAVIREYYPDIILTRIELSDDRFKFKITSADVEFRTVEIYRAPFGSVLKHHLGMVSGGYTAQFGRKEFVISSRLISSMHDLYTPNYYYFPSATSSVQSIVLKYMARGFHPSTLPLEVANAVRACQDDDDRWEYLCENSRPDGACNIKWNKYEFNALAFMPIGQATRVSELRAIVAHPSATTSAARAEGRTEDRDEEVLDESDGGSDDGW